MGRARLHRTTRSSTAVVFVQSGQRAIGGRVRIATKSVRGAAGRTSRNTHMDAQFVKVATHATVCAAERYKGNMAGTRQKELASSNSARNGMNTSTPGPRTAMHRASTAMSVMLISRHSNAYRRKLVIVMTCQTGNAKNATPSCSTTLRMRRTARQMRVIPDARQIPRRNANN